MSSSASLMRRPRRPRGHSSHDSGLLVMDMEAIAAAVSVESIASDSDSQPPVCAARKDTDTPTVTATTTTSTSPLASSLRLDAHAPPKRGSPVRTGGLHSKTVSFADDPSKAVPVTTGHDPEKSLSPPMSPKSPSSVPRFCSLESLDLTFDELMMVLEEAYDSHDLTVLSEMEKQRRDREQDQSPAKVTSPALGEVVLQSGGTATPQANDVAPIGTISSEQPAPSLHGRAPSPKTFDIREKIRKMKQRRQNRASSSSGGASGGYSRSEPCPRHLVKERVVGTFSELIMSKIGSAQNRQHIVNQLHRWKDSFLTGGIPSAHKLTKQSFASQIKRFFQELHTSIRLEEWSPTPPAMHVCLASNVEDVEEQIGTEKLSILRMENLLEECSTEWMKDNTLEVQAKLDEFVQSHLAELLSKKCNHLSPHRRSLVERSRVPMYLEESLLDFWEGFATLSGGVSVMDHLQFRSMMLQSLNLDSPDLLQGRTLFWVQLFRLFDRRREGVLRFSPFKNTVASIMSHDAEVHLQMLFEFLDWKRQGFLTAEDLRIMGREIGYFAASRFEALGQGLFKERYQRSTALRRRELGILTMNDFSYDLVFDKLMDSFIGNAMKIAGASFSACDNVNFPSVEEFFGCHPEHVDPEQLKVWMSFKGDCEDILHIELVRNRLFQEQSARDFHIDTNVLASGNILERGSLTELTAAIMSVVQTTFDNLPGTHHHLLPEFDQGLARIREQHFTTPQIPVVGERVGVLLDLLIDSLVELPSFCPSTRAPGFRHGSVELGVGRSQVAGLAMDSEELKNLANACDQLTTRVVHPYGSEEHPPPRHGLEVKFWEELIFDPSLVAQELFLTFQSIFCKTHPLMHPIVFFEKHVVTLPSNAHKLSRLAILFSLHRRVLFIRNHPSLSSHSLDGAEDEISLESEEAQEDAPGTEGLRAMLPLVESFLKHTSVPFQLLLEVHKEDMALTGTCLNMMQGCINVSFPSERDCDLQYLLLEVNDPESSTWKFSDVRNFVAKHPAVRQLKEGVVPPFAWTSLLGMPTPVEEEDDVVSPECIHTTVVGEGSPIRGEQSPDGGQIPESLVREEQLPHKSTEKPKPSPEKGSCLIL